MARFSETQTTLLSAAAARESRSLLPPPESLKATGKALDRTLAALVRRGFAAESRTRDEAGAWRRDDQGTQVGLLITAAGLAAIGVDPGEAAAAEVPAEARNADGDAALAIRPGGKLGAVLAAVGTGDGATIGELSDAACWQRHTTRAALTRLRQRGFDIRLETVGDRKAYRLHGAG